MRKYIGVWILVLVSNIAAAQNLVTNGDFEANSACPYDYSQTAFCNGWRSYHSGSSDYFNTCGTGILVSAPSNIFGWQQPLSGNGYMGVYTYLGNTSYKEYLARPIASLYPGVTYDISMSVSLANFSGYSTNDLGIWFYEKGGPSVTINTTSSNLIVTPQVSFSGNGRVTDTAGWVRLASSFVADSSYSTMVIGGFGSLITSYPVATGFGVAPIDASAYYYIDSIVMKEVKGMSYVLPDTAFCSGDTLTLPFYATNNNYYKAGNTFTLQLSNASGSFASPVTLATVSGGAGGTFKWVVPAAITNSLTYKIRIVSSNIADTSLISRNIIIGNFLPNKPVGSSNSPVCELNNLTLNSTNTTTGAHYTWSGPDAFNTLTQNTTRTAVTAGQGGKYIVTAWLYGCKAKDTVNVTVIPTVGVVNNTSNSPVCQGDSLKLFATSTASTITAYTWTGPNSFSSGSQNPFILNSTLAASGDYMVTGIYAGCASRDTVTVLVKPLPALPGISISGPLCQGGGVTLTASSSTSGTTYSWTGPNSFSSSLQSPVLTNLQSANTGIYTATYNLNGCSSKLTANLSVIPNGVSNTSASPICQGDSLKLFATVTGTATAYSWAGPSGYTNNMKDPVILIAPANASGDYIITVTTTGGCQAKDTVTVLVKPTPQHITTANDPLCTGDSLTLSANSTTSGVNYGWTGPSFTSTLQKPVRYSVATTASGNYIASYTTGNGCYAYDTLAVVVNQAPLAITASANTPVCQGDTLKIAATNSTSGTTWAWTGPASYSATIQNTAILKTPLNAAGRYYVKVSMANGCFKRDSVDVVVKPQPANFSASSNTPICQGSTLSFTGASTSSGTTYSWTGVGSYSSTAQSPAIGNAQPSASGDYILTGTFNGCIMKDTETVVVLAIPATPVPAANTPVCEGQTLTLSPGSTTALSYGWTSTTGYTSAVQNPSLPNASSTMAGTYTVRAINGGCISAPGSVTVAVIPAPVANVLSVGGDTVCLGTLASFQASAVNAGTGATYTWYYNNALISGASGNTYSTSSVNDLDEFFCVVTSNGTCATPFTDSSNTLQMRVLPNITPTVTVTANPWGTVVGGQLVNFNSAITNGGANPVYQWIKNGAPLGGAVNSIYATNTLNDNDIICLEMTSSEVCPMPKKVISCVTISVNTTGINSVQLLNGVHVYPNPASTELNIEGITKGSIIQLLDISGRVVMSKVATKEKELVNASSLAPGTYLLNIINDNGKQFHAKVMKE